MNCSQRLKDLPFDEFLFSEGTTNSCYSVPTLRNPWTYVNEDWYYKVWQLMNPPELLLQLRQANFEIYLE